MCISPKMVDKWKQIFYSHEITKFCGLNYFLAQCSNRLVLHESDYEAILNCSHCPKESVYGLTDNCILLLNITPSGLVTVEYKWAILCENKMCWDLNRKPWIYLLTNNHIMLHINRQNFSKHEMLISHTNKR